MKERKKFEGCLYFTTSALARKVEKMAQACWKEVQLSPSHAYLLMLVLDEPGAQPGFLADQLQLQPSTITRLMEKLEARKLIVRTSEGKITNVYPTPRAKEMGPKMKAIAGQFYQQYTAILGKDKSGELIADMSRVADKLND